MPEPPEKKIKTICVLGSPHLSNETDHWAAATDVGKALADRELDLIYGGGSLGLRGCVATSALQGGRKVFAITLQPLTDHRYITGKPLCAELQVASMYEKIAYMLQSSDAFIMLPGGFDTIEEFFNLVSWANFNIHQKPIGILNVDGFYDDLLSYIDKAVEYGFMPEESRNTFISASNINELLDQLQKFKPQHDPLYSKIAWPQMNSNNSVRINNSKKRSFDLSLKL